MTEGDSVNPEGEVSHRSDRTKAAKEEKETLKEDEMGVDADAPRGESADTKKHAKEGDSGRIRRSPRLPLWDAGNQPGRSRGIDFCAPSAFSEPRGSIYFCDNSCSEKSDQILAVCVGGG